jgi:glutathionylspermidine synthase
MERHAISPRPDWRAKVESLGLLFHTTDDGTDAGVPYWSEDAYYTLTEGDVQRLESATNELHARCLDLVQHVIDEDRFAEMHVPEPLIPVIRETWETEPPSLYGRFDLAYDGTGEPKLLEYNADTPTSLLEAAVIQWHWAQERFPSADQFNGIWECLVEMWKRLKAERALLGAEIHFAHVDEIEDLMTVAVLQDTAQEAGLVTSSLGIDDVGWDPGSRCFVDLEEMRIWSIFKLYPWEWIAREEFMPMIAETIRETQWMEPAWKAVLSNKAILPLLWERFPGHPNLLPAYFDGPRGMSDYVSKPIFGREGSNVTVFVGGQHSASADGPYSAEPLVYQQLAPIRTFDGFTPVIGSWVVDHASAGVGIRESRPVITDNFSRFVPHVID